MMTFNPEQRVLLRQLLQNATIVAAIQYVRERCPKSFIPGADTKPDQVAMQAAHRQGWEDCIDAFMGLADDSTPSVDSQFMEMNDEPENDRNSKRS